jgi:hypothetical protein
LRPGVRLVVDFVVRRLDDVLVGIVITPCTV